MILRRGTSRAFGSQLCFVRSFGDILGLPFVCMAHDLSFRLDVFGHAWPILYTFPQVWPYVAHVMWPTGTLVII